MTVQSEPYSRVNFLIERFSDWIKHRRELNEMRQLDRSEFDRIAADLEIAPSDLDELVRRGPHAGQELPALLKALGIDETRLERSQPLVLRDMERVCAMCSHKRQCDHDLIEGTSAQRYEDYCPNTSSIAELETTAG
jgi:hypothetical protein